MKGVDIDKKSTKKENVNMRKQSFIKRKGFKFVMCALMAFVLVSTGVMGSGVIFASADDGEGFSDVDVQHDAIIGPNWNELYEHHGDDIFDEIGDWHFIADQVEEIVENVEEEWAPVIEHHESIANTSASRAATQEVSNWAELRVAMANESISHITLTNSITRTAVVNDHLPNINRSLTISGNGHTLDFGGNNNRAFMLSRRLEETFFKVENIRFANMRMDYLILHADTTAAITQAGRFTENWIIHLHDVDHVEQETPAALVKAQNSEMILTGNISWNTTNTRNSNAIGSTSGMIVIRGLTITNQANVDLRARHTIINVNPNARDWETFLVISGGSNVNLYSRERATIWMNRSRTNNNPVLFLVTGEGTVLNAKSDGAGNGQAHGVISVAGGDPRVADSSAIIVNNSARLYARSLREVGSGTRAMPAFISQISEGTFNIMGPNTKVELTSIGGQNTHGAVLTFPSLGQQNLNVTDRAELVVNRLHGASTASGIRFQGGGNTFNIYSNARVIVNHAGSGSASNTGNSAIEFTSGGAMHVFLSSTVELNAEFGPAVINSGGRFDFMTLGARDHSTFIARGRSSSSGGGIINSSGTMMLLENAAEYDFVNLRPAGGRVFNVNRWSAIAVINSELRLWRSGSDINVEAAESWPRLEFTATGSNYGTLHNSSYSAFTQDALGRNGLGAFSRIQGGVTGPSVPIEDLVYQINRSPSLAQSNDFTTTSWERFSEARFVAEIVRLAPNPPRAVVNDATLALRTAIDGLVNIRDLRIEVGISEAIRLAGQPEDIGHTDWNQFLLILSRAQTVLSTPNPTQRQVDEAFNNMRGHRERLGLEPIGRDVYLEELREEIEISNTLFLGGWPQEVPLHLWVEFVLALDQANWIYDDLTSTQEMIDGAKTTLTNARQRVEEAMANPIETDFTELRAEIERSAAVVLAGQPPGLTPSLWNGFIAAYGHAQLVAINHLATQDEVDNAKTNLSNLREQVQYEAGGAPEVDLTALREELALSEAVYAAGRGNVTLLIWNGFVIDLRVARSAYANEAVTQTQVDLATAALTNSRLRVIAEQ